MKTICALTVIGLSSVVGFHVAAQSTPPLARPLSLAQAQAEARAHAPDSAQLDARVRGAELAVAAASRVFRNNPTLSGTYGPGLLTGHAEDLSWEVGLSQTFDISGSWGPRGASAAAARESVRHDRDNGLRALDEAVAVAVADVAVLQRAASRSARIVGLHRVSADAAREQLAVGEGSQLDVDAAELDLAAARADSARTQGALADARARLGRLLGRTIDVDIEVEDPAESMGLPPGPNLRTSSERDPRMLAEEAELRSARLELETHERTIWPTLTLGGSYGYRRRDIPAGSFVGPSANGLSALWTDTELVFSLSLAIPLFDRKQSERARALARILNAEAQKEKVGADVRQELESAWVNLRSASRAYEELAKTPEIIEREFALLDQAVRAGALDAVARAVALRRLQEAAGRYDHALRDLRIARARWVRRTAGL